MENYKRADYNTKLSRYIKIFFSEFVGFSQFPVFFVLGYIGD